MKITITLKNAPGLPDGEYVIEDSDTCCIDHYTSIFRGGREVHDRPSFMTVSGRLVSAPEGIHVEGS